MADSFKDMQPVKMELTGEPVEVRGYIVTPIAYASGRIGTSSDERASGRWGWMTIRPTKMIVSGPGGQIEEVTLVNAQAQAMSGMIVAGLLVAIASLLVTLLSRRKQKTS